MATAGRLREALKEYKDDEPLLWQFWSAEHAGIPEDSFAEVAQELQNSEVFLQELHELVSEWWLRIYERQEGIGPQLSYAELAELTHPKQVALYGWCSCEDGPKVYDDCTQDGS
jgi:hypothetical protein